LTQISIFTSFRYDSIQLGPIRNIIILTEFKKAETIISEGTKLIAIYWMGGAIN